MLLVAVVQLLHFLQQLGGALPAGAYRCGAQGVQAGDLAVGVHDGKANDELNAELCRLVVNLPPLTKRLLLFILKGRHGSSPPAVISEIAANLHCPLNNRASVCGTIIDQYTYAQIAGLDPCPDAPQPPIDDLKINYKAGRAAAENGAFGYIGKKKE